MLRTGKVKVRRVVRDGTRIAAVEEGRGYRSVKASKQGRSGQGMKAM